MKLALPVALLLMAPALADAKPPLRDPVALNIGLSCQWQQRCMAQQRRAMKRALKSMEKYPPAPWRVQMCNRNASRKGFRVDWVGFDNCIRNAALRAPAGKGTLKRRARNPV